MKLQDVLAISGQPGLFKYVAQGGNGGVIVESLLNGNRSNIAGSAKVSSLAEIAIYTDAEDMPLSNVFELIYKSTEGKASISHKSPVDQLKAKFAEILPEYDKDRVHVSDIKKVFAWYNLLVEAGMTNFNIEEEEVTTETEE